MPKMRFEYPETVPRGDRLPPHLVDAGLTFLEKLFSEHELPTVAAPGYIEWKYVPDGGDAEVFVFNGMSGVEGLIAYREQFNNPPLIGYDVVGVPLSRSFDIPVGRGQRIGGFFFRSYFNLPTDVPDNPPLPQGLPPVSLIMDEHLVFNDEGTVVGRMYRPYDGDGVMGRYSDRPDRSQHDLVGDQIGTFAATGQQLALPTAREAFAAAYPTVSFGNSPTPPPFMEGIPPRS